MADSNLEKSNLPQPVPQIPREDNEFILEFEKWLLSYEAPSEAKKDQREWDTFLELLKNWGKQMHEWNIHKLKKYLDFVEYADQQPRIKEHQKQLLDTEKLAFPFIIEKIQAELPNETTAPKLGPRYRGLKKYIEIFIQRADDRMHEIQRHLNIVTPKKLELDSLFNLSEVQDAEKIRERKKVDRIYNGLINSQKLYGGIENQLQGLDQELDNLLQFNNF